MKIPKTVAKLFNAKVKPEKTKIESKVEENIKSKAIVDCKNIALAGTPDLFVFQTIDSARKSSPIT